MPETGYSQFRLGQLTLADLDCLAVSAGSRAQGLREAVAYWRLLVRQAGEQNAQELSLEDWTRLGHLNQPDPLPSELREEEERSVAIDWSARLAQELVGMWEGRPLILPAHKSEAQEYQALARRIVQWDMIRGYALFACLRHFWRTTGTPDAWWYPDQWMGA